LTPTPNLPQDTFAPLTSKKLKTEELRSELQPLQEFQDKNPEVFELLLTQVPRHYDKVDLKKICEGMHIISTELDTDNLTGVQKGTGKIKLRCANEKKLKHFEYKLLKEGIEVKPRAKSNLVKNTWLYHDDKTKKESEPRLVKVRELESTVFGRPRKFTPVRQKRDSSFQSLQQWKKTRNAKKEFC
jgi:hypothetical protein